MRPTERRQRFRNHLAGITCVQPASVFDPITARIADALGFEIGMLGGSVASAVVLGAPDVAVLSLTELAQQAQRVTRASDISLVVDADHGYGNALGVMRTVHELENAEVSAMTIEDSSLPAAFGASGSEPLISTNEMTAKLRAALEARADPATVIIGRTHAMRSEGLESTLARARAYAATGVDAIMVVNMPNEVDVSALEAAGDLPLVIGGPVSPMTNEQLAAHRVRVVIRGHAVLQATVKAVYEALSRQAAGQAAPEYADLLASTEQMGVATGTEIYERLRQDYLG
jgi:carboxyvinyl-carboxyphosphonate phosphorylmutase